MFMGVNHDDIAGRQSMARQVRRPSANVFRQARFLQVEPQFHGARDFVDVLSAGT